MPLGSTSEEISLRHLPDVSDSSFSFQIPGAAQEYNLLAEDDLDFFSGANVSGGAIPPSPPTNTAPLTIQELTPRPAFETRTIKRSRRKLSSEAGHSDNDNQKEEEETRTTSRLRQPERSEVRTNLMSNLRPITTSLTHPPPADAPPSAERVTSPKQDIDTRTAALPVPFSPTDQEPTGMVDNQRPKGIRRTSLEKKLPPSRAERRQQKKAVARNKQIVIEGGVTKSRPTSKGNEGRSPARISNSVERPSAVFPSYARPTLSDDLNGDDSVIDLSMGPSGGVAERLVQYGQQLTNSFGIYTSSPYLPKHDPIGISNSAATAAAATEVKIIAPTEAPPASADDSDSDKPLTVSQLSPRKCPPLAHPPPTPPAKRAESPLRTSSKRPASAADYSENPPRKKGKTDGTPSAVGADGGPSTNLAPTRTRASSKQPTTSRAAASTSSRSKPMSEETSKRQTRGSVNVNVNRMADSKATTSTLLRRSKAAGDEGKLMTKYAATSTASSSRSTRVLRSSRPRDEDTRVPASSLLSSSSSSKGKGKAALTASSSSTSNSRRLITERVVLPPWDAATKPVPLQSFPESRLLARKGDKKEGNADAESQSSSTKSHSHSRSASQSSLHLSHSSQSQSSQYTTTAQTERDAAKRAHLVPIPDFRAMHAAQEAKLAQLKENVRPTVPHAPRLVTDLRVKERQRFDEMVREREAEQERVKEEQRMLREEEEERELKELRKRAVPRAHEVPEWYKEAPRKKGSKFDSVGR
ncbi:hypothetical protein BDN70DRAFT_137342 [Pholiota conissans]|uniref:TPX2 C-terminal domain-containing protein n=1 Tax=Pholiota conissans TaxID=109636 RepID=A0A9P5YWE8_9AGAR|nr:hypothetical protein BDN70DRAFT_137342 [Pholiota conissans]